MRKQKEIVVACDSFKGSLDAFQACEAVKSGVLEAQGRNVGVVSMPVADGGEGTAWVLVHALGGQLINVDTCDALGRSISATYGLLSDGVAVIELAEATGLTLIDDEDRNPELTSTFGTGVMIADALRRGCCKILLCIGGSATNDAAMGILSALGYRFLDSSGRELAPQGVNLGKVVDIDASGRLPQLDEVNFEVACDVTNPFYGPQGAAAVYGPQKGADAAMMRRLDAGLRNFARCLHRASGVDVRQMAGAGAAGGVGGGMKALLGATLRPGAELVLDAIGFERVLANASMVITGEGRMDSQTLSGKLCGRVLSHCMEVSVPVVGVCGSVADREKLLEAGFKTILPVTPQGMELAEAMRPDVARGNVMTAVRRFFEKDGADLLNKQ